MSAQIETLKPPAMQRVEVTMRVALWLPADMREDTIVTHVRSSLPSAFGADLTAIKNPVDIVDVKPMGPLADIDWDVGPIPTRESLIDTAISVNENYRCNAEEPSERTLEVGFLYGTTEMIAVATLLTAESYQRVREEIATQIDKAAAKRTYPLLPANGYKETR